MFLCILAASVCLFLCIKIQVLVVWLRVVGVLWNPVAISSWSSELSAPGMSRVCYVNLPVAVDSWRPLAHACTESMLRLVGCDHSVPCLQCSVWAADRCWPRGAQFISAGSGACLDLPLDMPLLRLIVSFSDVLWSWRSACWSWGVLGGTLVLNNVRCLMWLSQGNLFASTKQFTICDSFCWGPVSTGRSKQGTKAGFD